MIHFLFSVHVIQGRHISGLSIRPFAAHGNLYKKMQLLRKTLGHLSAVYCMMFDRSGKYIITVSYATILIIF